jgi:CDP-diacylglycerol pyrophosphatase
MLTTGRWIVIAAALAACAPRPATAQQPSGDRNALRAIISECLDPNVSGYCNRCPTPVRGACGTNSCIDTIDIWAQTPEFVAIRDRKMCDCPPGFVHGLAIPRMRVTGVEDPRRPNGIWAFAWRAALAHIADPHEIALAVNPPDVRTQDELHVHIVRLRAQGRSSIEALHPVVIDDLDAAWQAAANHAAKNAHAHYGVAVVSAGPRGYLVATTAASPEREFTEATCRRM